MSSKSSKSTRRPVRRAKKQTEQPVSELEWAKAYIAVPMHALTEVNIDPNGVNPFIQSSGSADTVHYVACGLEAISHLSAEEGSTSNINRQFGMHLILQTMVAALKATQGQMQHEHKLTRARGIVDAIGGAK